MKTNASIMTLRVPKELKHKIEKAAVKQGVSINQLALYFFSKEIAEMDVSDTFGKFWKGRSKEQIFADFDKVMANVPKKNKLPDWDHV